jgi:hypothetical protein
MEAIASKISSFVAAILSSPCWKYALHTKSMHEVKPQYGFTYHKAYRIGSIGLYSL